jgi:hypothetical protein
VGNRDTEEEPLGDGELLEEAEGSALCVCEVEGDIEAVAPKEGEGPLEVLTDIVAKEEGFVERLDDGEADGEDELEGEPLGFKEALRVNVEKGVGVGSPVADDSAVSMGVGE